MCVYVWRGQASGREGAEAHSGPMTHPFAGLCQQGRWATDSINRRTPLLITRGAPSEKLVEQSVWATVAFWPAVMWPRRWTFSMSLCLSLCLFISLFLISLVSHSAVLHYIVAVLVVWLFTTDESHPSPVTDTETIARRTHRLID